MPTIRVRPETYERMKSWAIPLEDTPNDVIERLLTLAEAHRNHTSRPEERSQEKPTDPGQSSTQA